MPRERLIARRFRDGRLWLQRAGPAGIGETSPSLLRESRIIFFCFHLARPLDFLNESKKLPQLQTRAIQHGSTTTDEYIGTICLAARLIMKSHLSFHRKSSLKLFCCYPPSERAHSLPLARFRRFFLGPLVLRANCLQLRVSAGQKPKPAGLQRWSAGSTVYFPFPFSPAAGLLQALSAGVGRLHRWRSGMESAVFCRANTFVFSLEMEDEQQCPESVSQCVVFGTDVSGCSAQDPPVSEKRVQVYFANLEQYFSVFVWLGRWIS
ncbi:Hypothetical_protein [Hexamita inflata]|uniref:Hypothetical_protein n=1 Tax=Hexamita inflata TaxID=28002 RepID=A0AA86U4W2_9EUKA|nr:Hypothetical protein HINF_LOCUS28589 [Hexamita inflata]